ncbi:MAG: GNAT family protein [Actinocatenispora sp.]
MLSPDFPLRTGRLLLRAYTEDDLDFVYDLESRPEVARYLFWSPRDREQARTSLRRKIADTALRAEGDTLTALVLNAETGERIGDAQLFWISQDRRQGEIGYVIHPDQAGHGYATEAAAAMLRLGFEGLDLHRITGRLDNRNAASARVLERLGMRREACLVHNQYYKGEWADEVVYGMLADEWRARETASASASTG